MGVTFSKVLCKVLGIEVGAFSEDHTRAKSLKGCKKLKLPCQMLPKKEKATEVQKIVHEQKLKEVEGETYSAGKF